MHDGSLRMARQVALGGIVALGITAGSAMALMPQSAHAWGTKNTPYHTNIGPRDMGTRVGGDYSSATTWCRQLAQRELNEYVQSYNQRQISTNLHYSIELTSSWTTQYAWPTRSYRCRATITGDIYYGG